MADIRERKPGFVILVNGEKPPVEPFFNVDVNYSDMNDRASKPIQEASHFSHSNRLTGMISLTDRNQADYSHSVL